MAANRLDDSRPYQVALTPMLKRIHLISRRNGYMEKVRQAYEEILREQERERERRREIAQKKQEELQKALELAAAAALGPHSSRRPKAEKGSAASPSSEPMAKRARHTLTTYTTLSDTVLGDGMHLEVTKTFANDANIKIKRKKKNDV